MEAAAAHWWIWPLALFAMSFAIGIVAVLRGVGGGVPFVPIVGGFGAIGFLGGLFGLGAGFANVPALNLLMAAPLKVAVGSSGLIISIINSSAAWVYIHRGALLPILAVPAILGVMLGSRIGARLLAATPAAVVRRLVIAVLLIAGVRALARGLGLWT